MASKPKREFVVRVGVNYVARGTEVRREPGDVADDIPAAVADAWLTEGVIEETR